VRSRARSAAGFTLLEVVLAMTSLAMLTAIVYGAFHLGTRAVERGQASVVTAQRLRVASDVLVRQLKSAVAYPARNGDEPFWYFRGNQNTMHFVTAAGLQGGGGQLVEVTYSIEDGPRCGSSPPCLLLTENPHISPDMLGTGRVNRRDLHTAVLLDGFRHMSFDYWDPEGRDEGGGYAARWNPSDHESLPPAVRISIDGLPGVETDTVVQEIPLQSFIFSLNADLGEMMGEPAEDKETAGATGAPGGATAQTGGEKDSDDAADEADEKDDE